MHFPLCEERIIIFILFYQYSPFWYHLQESIDKKKIEIHSSHKETYMYSKILISLTEQYGWYKTIIEIRPLHLIRVFLHRVRKHCNNFADNKNYLVATIPYIQTV